MNIDFFGFALTCAALYAATVYLFWWCYDNDTFSPFTLLLGAMGMTAFVTASLVYVTMIVFGG